MKVINQSKNTILAKDAGLTRSFFARTKGLLGRKVLGKDEGLILRPCNSVHTFFMKFPIDVVFLDKDNSVVKIISNLAPFRISGIYFKAFLAIELPALTAQSTKTSEGDIISLE